VFIDFTIENRIVVLTQIEVDPRDGDICIMSWTKEETAEYLRAWKLENPEKVMIAKWRNTGHFIPVGTEHSAYTRFSDTTHCEFCGWVLTTGGKTRTNTKVRHHDHDIDGEDNFIAVVCTVCNVRERCTNTSGEPNIHYHKSSEKWRFKIGYCGRSYTKNTFKTFEEALSYKAAWFALNSPAVFHVPAWTVELP